MKKFVNDYYANLNEVASREYLNAIGDSFDAIGDSFDAQGYDNGWSNAAGIAAPVRKSLPYILQLTNITSSDIQNVPIFYGNLYAKNAAALPVGVTYSVTNFSSYDAFLMQTTQKQFKCGKTYWVGSTTAQSSAITFTVINRDANGREERTPIVPILNKFANQISVNDDDTDYIIDGNTEMILSTLYGHSNLILHFYPATVISPKSELTGQDPRTRFANPFTGQVKPQLGM